MSNSPSRRMRIALKAAAAAADVIRGFYRGDFSVEIKDDRTPVTIADVEAERAIQRILSAEFPDCDFFGEETGRSAIGSEYVWLVDPIDGTKSFVRQYPFFSTQIALMHRGELILGVSSAPVFGEVASAERGGGAFLDGSLLSVSDISRLRDATVSTGNLKTLAAHESWERFGTIVKDAGRIRGYGDFYHYHLLASGKIEAVIESDVNVLDIAALTVIVREAGGIVTELNGDPITLASTTILAANPALHESLLERLQFRPG